MGLQDTMYKNTPAVIRDVTAAQFAVQRLQAPSQAQSGIIYRVDGQSMYYWNGSAWVGGVTAVEASTGVITLSVVGQSMPAPDHWSDHYVNTVISGITLPTSGGLSNSITSGIAYVGDNRISYAGAAVVFPASKDSYVDIDSSGVVTVTSVALAAAAPALGVNSMRLGYVTTDASNVTGATTGAEDSLGNWMGNRVRAPSCILRRYNNASFGGSIFSLSFAAGTDLLDNFSGHDGAGNPTRITIQKSGLYAVRFAANLASGYVDAARLKVNGSTDIRFPTMFFQSGNLTPQGSFECLLNAGDYIEMQITPNSGSVPFCYYSYFSAVKVG